MFQSAESVEKLITLLGKLPGVGRKSAGRLAFHILKMTPEEAEQLAAAIRAVKEKVGECEVCFNISESSPCHICSDPKRDRSLIVVVEEALDVISLEKVENLRGVYHVLGGRLSPLDGIGPDDLRIKELLGRVSDEVKEIVIATNPSVEGEATAVYLAKLLKPLGVRVTRIARGIPVGGDLEYADVVTLSRALEGRREF
ncbi:MAG TPA: recombination mediator RecR [candidate division Zixibacteria bacterium]|nr:recombination mediator RecR [candidate division Zixibacteria bacterium]